MDADSAKLNDDMRPGRGDSTMIDRRRTTAVLAAVGVLGVVACGADPKVLTSYTPAAGVNGKSDTVKVQNLVLINGGVRPVYPPQLFLARMTKLSGLRGSRSRRTTLYPGGPSP